MAIVQRVFVTLLAAGAFLAAGSVVAQTNDAGKPASASASLTAPDVVIGSGALPSNGAPTSAQRVFRDGVGSACNTKTFPGTVAGGPFHYQTASYTNTGPSRCVTITLSATCSGGGNLAAVFLTAYNGAFDPTNLATNYLGDTGSSTGTGFPPVAMRLNMTQGQAITLMIGQVNNTATAPVNTCNYSVSDDNQVPVPATSPAALALMAAILALMGFLYLRRRSAQR